MRYAGKIIAYGFIAISAISNFLFSFALARSPYLAFVYGSVGVLATLANAYIPIRMLQAWDNKRHSVLAVGAALLLPCIAFSITSALGFAASMRDRGTSDQAALTANYATTAKIVRELEALPKRTKSQQDALAKTRQELITYRNQGAMKETDPQEAALAALGIPDGRYYISLLFALLIEFGSACGLFLALADTSTPKREDEPVKSWARGRA